MFPGNNQDLREVLKIIFSLQIASLVGYRSFFDCCKYFCRTDYRYVRSGFCSGYSYCDIWAYSCNCSNCNGKVFLASLSKKTIYTMPQFLEQRFDKRVSLVLSFFWLAVYVFINLTSVLWLGSLAINTLTGLETFYGLVLLAILSLAYSLYGGLKAVALTDIIQVVLLIFGGFSCIFYCFIKDWKWCCNWWFRGSV